MRRNAARIVERKFSMDNSNELLAQFGRFDPRLDLPSYRYPSLDLLKLPTSQIVLTAAVLEANKHKIVETLSLNDIQVGHIKATIGPTLTFYEFAPIPGIRVAKIRGLEADLALHLAAHVRVIGPIAGKGTMGVEVPHDKPDLVAMRTVLATEKFQTTNMELPVALGKTMDNMIYIADLTVLPHLLIGGATGQGKSVFLNALIASLLYKRHPSELKLVLIDISALEFSLFRKISRHFLAALSEQADPVISNVPQAINTLNALCIELDQRYDLMKTAGVRNVREYNQKFICRKLQASEGHRYLSYIVTVIDEFAELMSAEASINRLAQLGRPSGIHLVISTQRPTVKVITGSIKANFSSRLAFRVSSNVDSRNIIDAGGAELLSGQGDMLFRTGTELVHLQGALMETAEVEHLCDFIGTQHGYPAPLLLPELKSEPYDQPLVFEAKERDPLFEDCARLIILHQQASASLIQRKLKLGYNRAGRIIDQLEAAGVVSPFKGSKAREVLFTNEYALERFLSDLAPGIQAGSTPQVNSPDPEAKSKGLWSRLFKRRP